MQIIVYEVLVVVGVAAFVLAKIWQAVKDRLAPLWERMTDRQREHAGYAIMAINALLMAATGLDMLPGFNSSAWAPWLGRVLTCIVAGVAPSAVYDIWLDRPEPPKS